MKNLNHDTSRLPFLALCATLTLAMPTLATPFGVGDRLEKAVGSARSAGAKAVAKKEPLERILELVEEARDTAAVTRDHVNAIVRRVELGSGFLDGSTLDQIRGQCADAVNMVKSQFEGRGEFDLERCRQFRADLIAFLTDVRTLGQEMRDLMGSSCFAGNVSARPSPLIDLIEKIPDGFLYPLWKGLPPEFECLVQDVREAVESVRTIRGIVGDLSSAAGLEFRSEDPMTLDAELFAARVRSARPYLEHHDLLASCAARLQKCAVACELVGTMLSAAGETHIEPTVGVHGYALLKISANGTKSCGDLIKGTGTVVGKIASTVNGKLGEAKQVSAYHLILSNQEQILRNQEALLAAGR